MTLNYDRMQSKREKYLNEIGIDKDVAMAATFPLLVLRSSLGSK